MIDAPVAGPMTIEAADLLAVERMITMRFPGTGPEFERAARMRTLVRVTAQLTSTLSTYSRHALVHCQGTAGASNLSEDTALLTRTLQAFCSEIRAVAAEYGEFARSPARRTGHGADHPTPSFGEARTSARVPVSPGPHRTARA